MKLNSCFSVSFCLLLAVGGFLATTRPASAATYGQQVVAAVLMAEAAGEGEEAMTAVAEVIRTRANQRKVSPLAVVKRKKQFSCLNNTTPEQLIRRHWRESVWSKALEIARTVYNAPENLPGVSKGATHFHSCRSVSWSGGKRPVAVIGKLKFYRLEEGR